MEAIYYDEAAALLGITSSALRHSVSGERKALTLLPRQGQKQRLIKEQVLLFKGKRLSLTTLNPQERQKWYEYAAMATTEQSATIEVEEIARQVTERTIEIKDEVKDDVIKMLIEALGGMLSRPKSRALA